MTGLTRASLLVSTACLCGCAAGPDYTPFSFRTPLAFASSGAEGSAKPGRWAGADLTQWWRSFRDPELNSLVERAVAANLDIEIALDRLQEARTLVLQWVGASLPSGDVSATKSVGTGTDDTRSRIDPALHAAADTAGYREDHAGRRHRGGLGPRHFRQIPARDRSDARMTPKRPPTTARPSSSRSWRMSRGPISICARSRLDLSWRARASTQQSAIWTSSRSAPRKASPTISTSPSRSASYRPSKPRFLRSRAISMRPNT